MHALLIVFVALRGRIVFGMVTTTQLGQQQLAVALDWGSAEA
jgi:hypothetical protein